jgi:hypothetical protein
MRRGDGIVTNVATQSPFWRMGIFELEKIMTDPSFLASQFV